MPTYDYRCKGCGHEFEEFQSMKSDVLVDCPKCGKPALTRLMGSGAGMVFKGSGFYLTDYKNTASSTSSSKSDSKSDTKPSTPSGSDSSKPAASSDTKPSSDSSDKK